MATVNLPDAVQVLYQKLQDLVESRYDNIGDLEADLLSARDELMQLLDKPPKNEKSRQALSQGKQPRRYSCKSYYRRPDARFQGRITILDVEYSINEEFKHETIQLADTVRLDELEAARLLIEAENDAENLGRPRWETALINFYTKRTHIVACWRLILRLYVDPETDAQLKDLLLNSLSQVLEQLTDQSTNEKSFARKCISAMARIRNWLQQIAEKMLGATNLGPHPPEYTESMEIQRTNLLTQHEDLAITLQYLAKVRLVNTKDFKLLLSITKQLERYDALLIHHVPPLVACMSQFGSPEGSKSFTDARAFHQSIVAHDEADAWSLRSFHAATTVWWLSEYSGWMVESHEQVLAAGVNVDEEVSTQTKVYLQALKDGAFDFMLSLCADVKPADWYDPVRLTLRQWLLKRGPELSAESIAFSDHFRLVLMEQLESFVDSLIINMPTNLRRLRVEEDQQRVRLLDVDPLQQDFDLEKFILIVSYIFENRPDAAAGFWQDVEGTLFGFLQWSSKRLSTPRACAVSEMLIALASGEENASAAHRFLNEGQASIGKLGKLRKSSSLSWAQILHELQYFTSRIRDPSASEYGRTLGTGASRVEQSTGEPETYNMLECYLRLASHLAKESSTARSWLLSQNICNLTDLLLSLCSSPIPGTLRACALETLCALLTDKTPELRDSFWLKLDQWIFGGSSQVGSLHLLTNEAFIRPWTPDAIFSTIADGAEERIAFAALMNALTFPCAGEELLNDALSFPEHLGAAHRIPGIEPYIDFTLGRLFGEKTFEIQDVFRLRILRLSCLEFTLTCLASFNENLIIFANCSNISADSAIRASSLTAYVTLHPFSRVMDWLFNEKVLQALFTSARQNVDEVSKASSDSPLVLGVLRAIEIIRLVLKLQSTHLRIVRPLISEVAANRSMPVVNSKLASFEDAILNNLNLLIYLGLYSVAEHQELAGSSLSLLETLATSPKLTAGSSPGIGRYTAQDRVIGVFEMNKEVDRVAKSMVLRMMPNDREVVNGPTSPEYATKANIIRFLYNCLKAVPNRPNLAHLFLGFSCDGNNIEIRPGSDFAKERSLFHAILNVVCNFPDRVSDISLLGFEVLQELWNSSVSAVYTMTELRAHDFLFDQLIKTVTVDQGSLFDGRVIADPEFFSSASAQVFQNLLRLRALLLEYVTLELRLVADEPAPTLRSRIISALLGTSRTLDGAYISSPSIFELFDFAEISLGDPPALPVSKHYSYLDLSVCLQEGPGSLRLYDLRSVEQLLLLRQNELRKGGGFSAEEEDAISGEASAIMTYIHILNQRKTLEVAKLELLALWARLVTLILEIGDLGTEAKAAFILQALQIVLPKLERYAAEPGIETIELARLSKALLFSVSSIASLRTGKAAELASDRLFHLFRISLRGIHRVNATSELREIYYNICRRYIIDILDGLENSAALQRNASKTAKGSGEALLDTLCDDAYSGQDTCRVSALLLLDALVFLFQEENSTYILDSLVRLNFLSLLVETIRRISSELRVTPASGKFQMTPLHAHGSSTIDVPLLLLFYDARFSLLLRISTTRLGATQLLGSGFFQAVRDSQLFSVDPDLGIGMFHVLFH